MFLSFGSHPQHCDKENETELPDYLPEEEEEPIDDKALARDKSETKGSGWLNSAASFFTNSFYWWCVGSGLLTNCDTAIGGEMILVNRISNIDIAHTSARVDKWDLLIMYESVVKNMSSNYAGWNNLCTI